MVEIKQEDITKLQELGDSVNTMRLCIVCSWVYQLISVIIPIYIVIKMESDILWWMAVIYCILRVVVGVFGVVATRRGSAAVEYFSERGFPTEDSEGKE